jgi:hypothetical protein
MLISRLAYSFNPQNQNDMFPRKISWLSWGSMALYPMKIKIFISWLIARIFNYAVSTAEDILGNRRRYHPRSHSVINIFNNLNMAVLKPFLMTISKFWVDFWIYWQVFGSARRRITGSGFSDWVYWHLITITADYNSSHIELLSGSRTGLYFFHLSIITTWTHESKARRPR